jgi:hypothetical protein
MSRYTEESQPAIIISPSEQLMPIAVETLKMRSVFLDHLNSLPAPFNDMAKKHYVARLVRAEDRHMLGEYAPFLLADVLQIPSEAVSEIVIPWLVLYEHTLLVDDLVDITGHSWSQEVLLTQILFDDFVSLWRDRFTRYPDLWQVFCRYHTEGVAAALEELNQSADIPPVQVSNSALEISDSHIVMGRKAALVKFCGAALSVETKGRFLNSGEESGIDKLCAGIQLLDDLSDSVEDHEEQRYTYPIRAALEWLQGRYDLSLMRQRVLKSDNVLSLLLLSGVTNHVVKLANQYLIGGLRELNISHDSTTDRYLRTLVESNTQAAEALERLLFERPSLIETMVYSWWEGEHAFAQLLTNPVYETLWTEMKGHFKSIATASN